ncbi:MAG: DegT/DnrJ/EryC1/StrS family aminotransferase [Cyanobacteria bacterium]|nr:DegT/DnrJ/EryC1/StrS family aminotransferase [Cyanobacteriota bacterium]
MPPPPLAILGGNPAFAEPRHVGTPFIPPRELLHASLDDILDARWLTNNGSFVHKLEQLLATRHGVSYAVAMCNATIALQLLFRALGLKGEIIVPSFTFIATAHAAIWEKLEPRFVEISPETHCIDPAAAAAAISTKTAALVGVNLWGQPCDVARLGQIANDAGIPLVLDAAQALGCQIKHLSREQPTAVGAVASVISLHATKVVSSLEGGAILTNDEALAEELRRLRNFGFAGYDTVVSLGTNAKLNEFSAAFAIRGLECLDNIIQHNRNIRLMYQESLADLPGVSFHDPPTSPTANHHYAVLMVDPTDCPLTRDELMLTLWAENVLARRYFYPGCHRMEPYASRPASWQPHLPATEAVAASVLVLPASSAVSPQDVVLISQRIRQALQQHGDVRERLQTSASA